MPVGLSLTLIALAQATSGAPAAQPASATTATPPPAAVKTKSVPPPDRADGCGPQPTRDSRTIVVCAPKPQGYRINPDVLEARREARTHTQPKPPETMKYNNCATVGPMGCRGNIGINLANAATLLNEMVTRAGQGGDVGQMFVTEPRESEYQLYIDAKKRREAKEAKDAAARAKAAALAPRSGAVRPPQTGPAAAPSAPLGTTATPAPTGAAKPAAQESAPQAGPQ